MRINIPAGIRQMIYIFVTIASPTMVYLNQEHVITDFWLGLYVVLTGAVTTLAAINVSPPNQQP